MPLGIPTSTELSTLAVGSSAELVSVPEFYTTSGSGPSCSMNVAESDPAGKRVARPLPISLHHETACGSVVSLQETSLRLYAQSSCSAVKPLEAHSGDRAQTSLGHGAQPQPFRVDPTLGCAADSVHSGGWGQTRVRPFPVGGSAAKRTPALSALCRMARVMLTANLARQDTERGLCHPVRAGSPSFQWSEGDTLVLSAESTRAPAGDSELADQRDSDPGPNGGARGWPGGGHGHPP